MYWYDNGSFLSLFGMVAYVSDCGSILSLCGTLLMVMVVIVPFLPIRVTCSLRMLNFWIALSSFCLKSVGIRGAHMVRMASCDSGSTWGLLVFSFIPLKTNKCTTDSIFSTCTNNNSVIDSFKTVNLIFS